MKRIIKNVIKKYFLEKAGLFSGRRTGLRVYKSVRNGLNSVEGNELKMIGLQLKKAENHKAYGKLLQSFVPHWCPGFDNTKFIGKGTGDGGLNVYRKVEAEEKTYFEKVYFNAHRSLSVIFWFEEYIHPLLKNHIKIPRIQKVYPGSTLTIIYFEYEYPLQKFGVYAHEDLVYFSKELYSATVENEVYLKTLKWPKFITNFKGNPLYKNKSKDLDKKLGDAKVCKQIEQQVTASKRVLTHTDLQRNNAFIGKILIDWDNFGYYPLGYEAGVLCSKLIKHNRLQTTQYLKWLEKHFKDHILAEDWPVFERNFIYFLLIFANKDLSSDEFEKLIDLLHAMFNV